MTSPEKLPERGGAAIILHVDGQVLLQKRTKDAPRWPSMWGVFGGNFDAGEDPVHAAAREVAEELSISIDPASLDFVCMVPVKLETRTGEAHYFAAPLTRGLSELRLGEGAGMALFGEDEIAGLQLIPSAREALHKFFETLDC